MSNVANCDDPQPLFILEGRFADGSRGITQLPGQSPQHWRLRDVVPMKSYTIVFPLDHAVLYFEWQFASLSNGCTRLTQHLILEGKNAANYQSVVQ
jgi:hypothetical protein